MIVLRPTVALILSSVILCAFTGFAAAAPPKSPRLAKNTLRKWPAKKWVTAKAYTFNWRLLAS